MQTRNPETDCAASVPEFLRTPSAPRLRCILDVCRPWSFVSLGQQGPVYRSRKRPTSTMVDMIAIRHPTVRKSDVFKVSRCINDSAGGRSDNRQVGESGGNRGDESRLSSGFSSGKGGDIEHQGTEHGDGRAVRHGVGDARWSAPIWPRPQSPMTAGRFRAVREDLPGNSPPSSFGRPGDSVISTPSEIDRRVKQHNPPVHARVYAPPTRTRPAIEECRRRRAAR